MPSKPAGTGLCYSDSMVLITHIIIALSSLIFTTYMYFAPSKRKFTASYVLIALTLASGTYLVVSTHAQILQSCTAGLLYLAVVIFGVVAAYHKLAEQTI